MTPEEIEAAHDRMDKDCDDAMARDSQSEHQLQGKLAEIEQLRSIFNVKPVFGGGMVQQ